MKPNDVSLKRSSVTPLKRKTGFFSASTRRRRAAFALYEVMIGVTIFALGVVALGRAVENCITAGTISAEEERIREILANRMAEVQVNRNRPDESKQIKIESGYGVVMLNQKTVEAHLQEEEGGELAGMYLVTLTAQWQRGRRGATRTHHVKRTSNVMSQWIRDSDNGGDGTQDMSIEFYVYRP